MRRRGYTPEAIRAFCERIGVAKRENVVDVALLEHAVREDLNRHAPRVMGVLDPLRVVIENYPEGQSKTFDVVNNPEDPSAGTRKVPFSRELYIERDDFREDPPKKFFRLAPGREVRLRVRLLHHLHGRGQGSGDRRGHRAALHLRSGDARRRCARRPQGEGDAALGSAAHAVDAEVRLYDRLFTSEEPGARGDFLARPQSGVARSGRRRAKSSRACGRRRARHAVSSSSGWAISASTRIRRPARLVFNRTVTLKDTWAKEEKKG